MAKINLRIASMEVEVTGRETPTQIMRFRVLVNKFRAEAKALYDKYAGTDIQNTIWAWSKSDQAAINRIISSVEASALMLGISRDEALAEWRRGESMHG